MSRMHNPPHPGEVLQNTVLDELSDHDPEDRVELPCQLPVRRRDIRHRWEGSLQSGGGQGDHEVVRVACGI